MSDYIVLKKKHQKQAGELVYKGKSQGNKGALLWNLMMNLNFALSLGRRLSSQV